VIDPVGANELVARIQSYFDKEDKNSEEIIEPEPEEIFTIEEESTQEVTTAPVYTWTIQTGSLVELDYILSGSTQTPQSQQTGSATTGTTSSSSNTSTQTTTTTTPKTTSTSPKKSLSKQDEADMKAFLNAIVE